MTDRQKADFIYELRRAIKADYPNFKDFAYASGIREGTIYNYVSGTTAPGLTALAKMAACLPEFSFNRAMGISPKRKSWAKPKTSYS